MQTLNKMRHIFNRQIKVRLIILLAAIIAGALLEIAALTVISPFISVLLNPSVIEGGGTLNFIFDLLGFKSRTAFMAFMAFVLAGIYIFRGAYSFLLGRTQYRFLSKRQVELSDRLLTMILNKPYLYHTGKNLAELQRIILSDVGNLIQLILHVLFFLSDFFMSFFVFIFLLFVSMPMTVGITGLALFCIFIYYKIFRVKIKETGEETRIKSVGMTKSVNQALGGIKELKVLRRESYFTGEFKKNGIDFIKANQKFQVYNSIPRVLIEAICFGGALTLIGVFINAGINMDNIVPQLSLFVLASFRLLPAISRFAGYINAIIFLRPSVDAVYESIFDKADSAAATIENIEPAESTPDISVRDITFYYPGSPSPVLESVSLTIPQKKSVAFVGPTGAGKTTLADIILGVYTPQKGSVIYNGKSIHANFDEWATKIGYIPQQIYLMDETVRENIAFGVPRDKIDEARVWRALEQAQLDDFINSLPDKLEIIAGDRGVRLSGGQRQRIGIARALYNNPSILVLDEATSSLDNETERAVMDAIESFQGEKTMIIIAHRLSTIEHCDIIYRVENKNVFREK